MCRGLVRITVVARVIAACASVCLVQGGAKRVHGSAVGRWGIPLGNRGTHARAS